MPNGFEYKKHLVAATREGFLFGVKMEGTIEKEKILSIILDGPVMSKWSVQCETNSDANLLETIDNHAELAGDMMYALFQVSEWKDDGRYSAKECGKKAYNSLLNLAYDLIGYLDTNDLKKLRDSINEYSLEGDEQC